MAWVVGRFNRSGSFSSSQLLSAFICAGCVACAIPKVAKLTSVTPASFRHASARSPQLGSTTSSWVPVRAAKPASWAAPSERLQGCACGAQAAAALLWGPEGRRAQA
eukprot:scaffold33026_cov60-Phaeocystis_antarctica.AAC.2